MTKPDYVDYTTNPRIKNWMRVTGETEFDPYEFRAWLRFAMDLAWRERLDCVVKFEDDPYLHIWDHAQFDDFLDIIPCDVGLTMTEWERAFDKAIQENYA